MLVPYTVRHQYFNDPIFLVGYADARYGHNVTTCSSAYSLGDMYAFALSVDTNAAAQLRLHPHAAINFLAAAHLDMIEFAGHRHGRDKLADPRFAHRLENGVPVLDASFAALIVTIQSSQEYHGYVNFIAQIDQRLVQDADLHDGKWAPQAVVPVGYAGDAHAKVYRTPGEHYQPGRFLR